MKRKLALYLAEAAPANGAAFAVALIEAATERPVRHYAGWATALESLLSAAAGNAVAAGTSLLAQADRDSGAGHA